MAGLGKSPAPLFILPLLARLIPRPSLREAVYAGGWGWGLNPRVEFAMPATAGPLPHLLQMGGGGTASRAGARNSSARGRLQPPPSECPNLSLDGWQI